MEDDVAREMVVRVAKEARFTLTGQRIDIYGFCERCSTNTNAAKLNP